MAEIGSSPLGKKSRYDSEYDPALLFPIPRKTKRDEIQVPAKLPFQGADLWTGYELSWLNQKGKPCVGILELTVPCNTPRIFESKSLKLYLNSLNQTCFENTEGLQTIIRNDLNRATGGEVDVHIFTWEQFNRFKILELPGTCIDGLDIDVDCYTVEPKYLQAKGPRIEETLCSHLLKSNCLVTNQPDWGSVQIRYSGPKINQEGLLKYLVSFRMHNEFHEQCVERIFMDISRNCRPEKLTVYARYTRRGGLDINPFRSNFEAVPENIRTSRQ